MAIHSRRMRMRPRAVPKVVKRRTAMETRQRTALSTTLILGSLCRGASARGQMVSISVRQQPRREVAAICVCWDVVLRVVKCIIPAVDQSARVPHRSMVHLVSIAVIRAGLGRHALATGTRSRRGLLSRSTGTVRVERKGAVDAYVAADATDASAGKGCMQRRTGTGCRGHGWSEAGAIPA